MSIVDHLMSDLTGVHTPSPARNSDPDTSHQAALSVDRTTARKVHQWIIDKLTEAETGMTHEQLWICFEWEQRTHRHDLHSSPSGLRTRLSELVRGGVAYDTKIRTVMSTGRRAIVWSLTPPTE